MFAEQRFNHGRTLSASPSHNMTFIALQRVVVLGLLASTASATGDAFFGLNEIRAWHKKFPPRKNHTVTFNWDESHKKWYGGDRKSSGCPCIVFNERTLAFELYRGSRGLAVLHLEDGLKKLVLAVPMAFENDYENDVPDLLLGYNSEYIPGGKIDKEAWKGCCEKPEQYEGDVFYCENIRDGRAHPYRAAGTLKFKWGEWPKGHEVELKTRFDIDKKFHASFVLKENGKDYELTVDDLINAESRPLQVLFNYNDDSDERRRRLLARLSGECGVGAKRLSRARRRRLEPGFKETEQRQHLN